MATVLMVGLDPDIVDFSQWPDLSPEHIRQGLKFAFERLRAEGHQPNVHLVADTDGAGERLRSVLAKSKPDVIMFGAGVRVPSDQTVLFEALINAAHRAAPDAVFAFNVNPQDTFAAVQRALASA